MGQFYTSTTPLNGSILGYHNYIPTTTATTTTIKPHVTDFRPGKKSVTGEDPYPPRPQQTFPESSESPTQMRHAWHLYMLRLNLEHLSIDRARFIEELKKRNIGTSVHFIPLHIHPYYRETYGYQPEDYPVAYHEYQREISLPIYSRMTDADINDVIEAVLDVANTYEK